MSVRSLTLQLAAEAADATRRRAFPGNLAVAGRVITSGNGDASVDGADDAPDKPRPLSVPVNLPDLAVQHSARDTRWKPPGGVAARFRIGERRADAGQVSKTSPHGEARRVSPRSADDGGNGKASVGKHADPDADAITIELKSS